MVLHRSLWIWIVISMWAEVIGAVSILSQWQAVTRPHFNSRGQLSETFKAFQGRHWLGREKQRQGRHDEQSRNVTNQINMRWRDGMMSCLIISPFQGILRVSLISLGISEWLDRIGFFDSAKLAQVAQQVQLGIQQWWSDDENDWNGGMRFRQPMEPKHQFAIGLTCGWMTSCFVGKLAKPFLEAGVFVYAVSETAHFVYPEVPALENLDQVRYWVRRRMQKPRATLDEMTHWIRHHTASFGRENDFASLSGTAADGIMVGVTAGLLFEVL